MDGWMDKWMDGRMDKWMDGWMDGGWISVFVGYCKWTHSLRINYPGWVCADVT